MIQAEVLERLFGDRKAVDGSLASENFARWFSESRATDASGAPQVVFHGTRGGAFSAFKPRFREHEHIGFGIHFAHDRSFAERYAHDPAVARKKSGSPHVFEVVLSVQNPLLADAIVVEGSKEFSLAKKIARSKLYVSSDEHRRPCVYMQNAVDSTTPQRALKILRDEGYDGVFYKTQLVLCGVAGSHMVTARSAAAVVFEPWQIKSIQNNTGLFRTCDASIDDGASLVATAMQAREAIKFPPPKLRP